MALLTNIAGFGRSGRHVGTWAALDLGDGGGGGFYTQVQPAVQADPLFTPIEPAVQGGDTGPTAIDTSVTPTNPTGTTITPILGNGLPTGNPLTGGTTVTPAITPVVTPSATSLKTYLPVVLLGAYVLWVTFSETRYRKVIALGGLGLLYYQLKKQSTNG